jgi:hypothetical protein
MSHAFTAKRREIQAFLTTARLLLSVVPFDAPCESGGFSRGVGPEAVFL